MEEEKRRWLNRKIITIKNNLPINKKTMGESAFSFYERDNGPIFEKTIMDWTPFMFRGEKRSIGEKRNIIKDRMVIKRKKKNILKIKKIYHSLEKVFSDSYIIPYSYLPFYIHTDSLFSILVNNNVRYDKSKKTISLELEFCERSDYYSLFTPVGNFLDLVSEFFRPKQFLIDNINKTSRIGISNGWLFEGSFYLLLYIDDLTFFKTKKEAEEMIFSNREYIINNIEAFSKERKEK